MTLRYGPDPLGAQLIHADAARAGLFYHVELAGPLEADMN